MQSITKASSVKGIYFNHVADKPQSVEVTANQLFLKIDFIGDPSVPPVKWDHHKVSVTSIHGASKLAVKYLGNEAVEVDALAFGNLIKDAFPQAPYLHHIKKPETGVWKALSGVLILIITLAVVVYLFAIPLITVGVVKLIPLETEISLGKEMAQRALSKEKINKAKTRDINQFLKQLKFKSKYPIHVTVVESDIKNAFAIPGGEIVVYTGLLNQMESYPELVSLLGHEMAHVDLRHSLNTIVKSLSLYLIVSAVLQDVQGIFAVLIDNAAELEKLSYSRDLESEADEQGLSFVLNNNTDPKGMVDLFNHLKGGEKADVIPDFLATHPSLDKRIEALKEKLPSLKYKILKNDSLQLYWGKLKK